MAITHSFSTQGISTQSKKKILCRDWIEICRTEHKDILPSSFRSVGKAMTNIVYPILEGFTVQESLGHILRIRMRKMLQFYLEVVLVD